MVLGGAARRRTRRLQRDRGCGKSSIRGQRNACVAAASVVGHRNWALPREMCPLLAQLQISNVILIHPLRSHHHTQLRIFFENGCDVLCPPTGARNLWLKCCLGPRMMRRLHPVYLSRQKTDISQYFFALPFPLSLCACPVIRFLPFSLSFLPKARTPFDSTLCSLLCCRRYALSSYTPQARTPLWLLFSRCTICSTHFVLPLVLSKANLPHTTSISSE